MDKMELMAKAYEEAQRIIEKCFSFDNPYTCEIYAEEIPHADKDNFYAYVEGILNEKGYNIFNRRGPYFKIVKYNRP